MNEECMQVLKGYLIFYELKTIWKVGSWEQILSCALYVYNVYIGI